ncbi:aldo/keto reductase [Diaminobutyricibacter tongyongensis]|uniref:Aldo/keto reductase n=2 Tax=Leifsonia tongyongensis TaxID=1268043 RepID=A0A6L9XV43_9MICO|nr:aldo/keto reductase [Diaminobutyricibacter tongyongensis]
MIEPTVTEVGNHGLTLPSIGFGTAALGNFLSVVPERQAVETLQHAYESGIRYFDTAPLYGHGLSEQRIANSIAGEPRDNYVLSTKIGRLLRPDAPRDESQYDGDDPFYVDVPPVGPVWDFSYEGVITSLHESLERLQLDRVDILNMHDPDDHYTEARDTAYAALRDLREQGTVTGIGAGMNTTPILTRLVESCDLDVVLLAGRYTLLDQSSVSDLLPACRANGTAVIVGGVFNSGILIDPSDDARFDYVPASGTMLEKARRIRTICDRYGVPLAAAAIQFPLAHPQITTVLIGARSVDELHDDLALLAVPIPDALWHDIRSAGLLDPDVPVPSLEGAVR